MSCGRHWYFFCTWHLHLSFAARFFNMPYFGSHWAVTRLRNFIKSGTYIAKHFVLMLIFFKSLDKVRVSDLFVCVWKNTITFEQECICCMAFLKSIAWVRAFKFVLRAYKGTQDIVPKSRRVQIFVFLCVFWLTRVLTRGCLVSGRSFECFFFINLVYRSVGSQSWTKLKCIMADHVTYAFFAFL